MTFTAIIVAHNNPSGVSYMLRNVLWQTRRPDEVILLYSGRRGKLLVPDNLPRFLVLHCPNREDFGQEKRAQGLAAATGDWVAFFNDDDSYAETYVAEMMAAGENADIVQCPWIERNDREPQEAENATAGNFIIRRQLAQEVGYRHRHYQADSKFVFEVLERRPRVVRLDRVLYRHNLQPWVYA